MTEYERMVRGLIYDPMDKEIQAEQVPLLDGLWAFNQLKPSDPEKKEQYMKEVFAECGENCYIELPFHANWGGAHVHFGSGIYANSNLTLVDDGHIYIGNRVMIGPNVVLTTANHPIEPELRARGLQYNKDIHIGENAWIGAGVIVVPGVSIGKNAVIGAGSVVTKDIPDGVVAVGNPCRVLREVSQHDREYFYKNERIDWDELDKRDTTILMKDLIIVETELSEDVLAELIRLSADWEAEESCHGYRKNERSDIEGNRIFLARRAGVTLGYLFGHTETAKKTSSIMPEGTLYFEVEELYVRPECRSQGIGRQLFDFAEHAVSGEVSYMMLSTATKNWKTILHFYLDEQEMSFWSARLFKKIE